MLEEVESNSLVYQCTKRRRFPRPKEFSFSFFYTFVKYTSRIMRENCIALNLVHCASAGIAG